jgi:hypothetical protein
MRSAALLLGVLLAPNAATTTLSFPMISKVAVPGASVARATPSATPAVPAKGALGGVYLTLKASGGFDYGVSKDYVVFFPDGRAFWHLPAEGLLDFDAAASQKESPDFWGRWEMKGDAIAIHLSFYVPDADGGRTPRLIVINTFSIVRRP